MKKGFDLSTTEQTDTATVPLVHPVTGEEIGATVTVYGTDSEHYQAEARKCELRFTEYARRNRGKLMPPDERDAMDRGKIARCVVSIDGLMYKGQALTDPADVFVRFPWVYEQVCQAIADRGNFMKGSSAK